MFVIFGERKFGKVDRVPGVCYVVTVFAHLNFLPLLPLRGYIVVEGSESGGEFRGKPIGLSLRSVFVGYTRAWVGAFILIFGLITAINLFETAGQTPAPAVTVGVMVLVGVCGFLGLFIPGRAGVWVMWVAHLGSAVLAVLCDGIPKRGADALVLLAVLNGALFLYELTRLFDHAGAARRRWLMTQLGMDVPPEDDDGLAEAEAHEPWDESEDRKRR